MGSLLAASTLASTAAEPVPVGLEKIDHVIVIMQENHSFDHYFGTYPGANGLPTDGTGHFTSCLPDPYLGDCMEPYHSPVDGGIGGDHGNTAAIEDINGGAMDGFLTRGRNSFQGGEHTCELGQAETCVVDSDVMSYKDAREIPNYWRYADAFTLADNAFEYIPSWSLISHLYMVSEWAADCASHDPLSCQDTVETVFHGSELDMCAAGVEEECPNISWTDMTQLLYEQEVSWGYYVNPGEHPDCNEGTDSPDCVFGTQNSETPSIWNPLPFFDTVEANGQLDNIQDAWHFFDQAAAGTLPAVSWIVPNERFGEHPTPEGGQRNSDGQRWVTALINSVMSGPDWDSTAIFVTWDDWGGFYDHVAVPESAGIRVPLLVISPYAKPGFVDHSSYGLDAVNRLIQDRFLGGDRLDPATLARPDSRPVVNELRPFVGDLLNAFDFNQAPLPPLILPLYPMPGAPSCIDGIVCDQYYVTGMTSLTDRVLAQGASGQKITVKGSHFVPGTVATFTTRTGDAHGSVDVIATQLVNSRTLSLTVNVQPSADVNTHNLILTAPDGSVARCNGCLIVVDGPEITSITPDTLTQGVQTSVTIRGTGFTKTSTVTAGGRVVVVDQQYINRTKMRVTLKAPFTQAPTTGLRVTVRNARAGYFGADACNCMTVVAG
jgi:phospholipase C